jgi:hypothetical protein
MKKAMAMLVTLVLFVPPFCWAYGEALKENIGRIADIDLAEIRENGHLSSTTVDLKMIDGKEFQIAVDVDKNSSIATFTFASGKTAILSPEGIEVIEGEGYQDFDDIDNTENIAPDGFSRACLLNVIGYWILPYPLDEICLYLVFLYCL